MRIAIIGSGISGLTAAYYLSKKHDIHVFEKADRLGGHTATIDVSYGGEQQRIDTGFIVFNQRTYPNFIRLLKEIGAEFTNTSMGFSVSASKNQNDKRELLPGLEYAGNSLGTLFAQKKRLFSPKYLRMIRDILRFNKIATGFAEKGDYDYEKTLGDYLKENRFSLFFFFFYLLPMGSAIWSSSYKAMMEFSAAFFIRFFYNHGLLSILNKPQWYVIKNGSNSYIPKLTQPYKDSISLNAQIKTITRNGVGVEIVFENGERKRFDSVVMACHSDEALALLGDASEKEKDVLGAIPYENNSVVLHADERLLPTSRKVWSSWNYLLRDDKNAAPVLTYNMNILQNLNSKHTYCVTLNADELIDESKIIGRFNYAHPQFGVHSVLAQKRWTEINGSNHTWFCGAYWGNGFHEDGVSSAVRVAEFLGVDA